MIRPAEDLFLPPGANPAVLLPRLSGAGGVGMKTARFDEVRKQVRMALNAQPLTAELYYYGACAERQLGDRAAEDNYDAATQIPFCRFAAQRAAAKERAVSLDETTTASSVPSPGAPVARGARATGMSQEDIAAKLKLSVRQVTAIETGDWSPAERTFTAASCAAMPAWSASIRRASASNRGPHSRLPPPNSKPTPQAGEIAHESITAAVSRVARWAVPATLIAVLAGGRPTSSGVTWSAGDRQRDPPSAQ